MHLVVVMETGDNSMTSWNSRAWDNSKSTFTPDIKRKEGKMFHPKLREAKPSISQIDTVEIPTIRISKTALHKMFLYVKIGSKEVGWMGTLMDNRDEGNEFYLKDVFLAEQEVSSVTTNLTPDGVAELMNELMTRPDAMEVCNNLKFWGHSHVNMGVGPSAQDETTVKELRGGTSDYFLRGIFNKSGEVKFTLFLYDSNVKIDDVEWYSEDEIPSTLEAEIEREFNQKVTEATNYVYVNQNYNTYGNNYAYGADYNSINNQGGYVRPGSDIPRLVTNKSTQRRYDHEKRQWVDENGKEIVDAGVWGYVNGVYRQMTEAELLEIYADELQEAKAREVSEDKNQERFGFDNDDEVIEIDVDEEMKKYGINIDDMTDEMLEDLADDDEEYLQFLNLKYGAADMIDIDYIDILARRLLSSKDADEIKN